MRHAEKLILVILAIGILSGSVTLASTAQENLTARASDQRQMLVHDGVKRSYVIHAPDESARNKGRVPLVLVLHGGGGNAANAERMTGFSKKADSEGFIVVYPEGTSRFRDKLLTWNAGHCCGYAMLNRVDDTGFIRTLIDTLIKDYSVDPKRVYVTGMSNGGMMAHRLGRELPDRIAALTFTGSRIALPAWGSSYIWSKIPAMRGRADNTAVCAATTRVHRSRQRTSSDRFSRRIRSSKPSAE